MTADGETPLADFDGLRKRHVRTRAQLAIVEAENVRHAVIRYLVAQPSRRIAPFDFGWMLRLHAEMFGEVWSWAGKGEKVPATKSGPLRQRGTISRKSASWVTSTRSCAEDCSKSDSSSDSDSPFSWAVLTSMPRRRRASATASGT